MNQPTVCTWANVEEGCAIACSVSGSNSAHLLIGDNQLEVEFDAEALRKLEAMALPKQAGEAFAREGGLAARKVDYLPEPATPQGAPQ